MEREILEYRSTHCVDHGADTHWYLEFYLKASINTLSGDHSASDSERRAEAALLVQAVSAAALLRKK